MARLRADMLLVKAGHFDSRAKAREAIEAGLVTADGRTVIRPAQLIDETAAIEAQAPYPYVSRGGVKLNHGLDAFRLDPAGLTVLDAGSSTGGFTDVLLRRGAAHVHAVDVGRDQMHPSLRGDPRVTLREGVDVRTVAEVVPNVDAAVVDVSFIGLGLVLPAIVGRIVPGGWLVALIKPQFEVGRAFLDKGIVRDSAARDAAVASVVAAIESMGGTIVGSTPSPIAGGDGNIEYLVGARFAEAARDE